jgi:hypothetical protein
MKDKVLESKVVSIMEEDLQVKEFWSQPPDVTLIPYTKNRQSYFLLISICFTRAADDFDFLSRACIYTLRRVISSGVCSGLPALEIDPFILEESGFRRVLRLCVKAEAFDAALGITPQDLLKDVPSQGITCGWYGPKPDVRGI